MSTITGTEPASIRIALPFRAHWTYVDQAGEVKGAGEGEPGVVDRLEPCAAKEAADAVYKCLYYFEQRSLRLVVRLNTHLYGRTTFLDRGIDHMELYFDDGTNPTDEIVRTFLDVADRVIEGGGAVAVHCKAGLGSLIGAYLIWKYGFTASEAIAFMHIVRLASVVGPHQEYLYLKQLGTKWAAVDKMKRTGRGGRSEGGGGLASEREGTGKVDGASAGCDAAIRGRR